MKKSIFNKGKRGNISVIAAVSFAVVLVLCGLVIDIGSAYRQAAVLQTAADSSSIAASSLLPVSILNVSKITAVKARAREYALKNGVDSGEIEDITLGGVISGYYTTVEVSLNREVDYMFGRIAGIDGTVISKESKAQVQSVKSSTEMVPLGIEKSSLANAVLMNNAQNVVVKYGAGDSTTGWFGAIDLDGVKGGGAKDYATWLAYGYDGVINTGDFLFMENGNMAGPTQTAFTIRYNQCTHFSGQGGCTVDHFDPDCPRVVYLIVYEQISTSSLKVVGFSPFVLVGTNKDAEIIASHVNVQTSEGTTVPVDAVNINFGLFKSRLIA